MGTKLHFANYAPSSTRSTLLSVLDGSHKFSFRETMQEHFSNGGNIENWSHAFLLIIITDKDKADLDYLLDDTELGRVHSFSEPIEGSEHWNELASTGQISLTFADFEQYIRVN